MADKKQFSVRLPPDTAEALEDYCDERDISYADALRRFTQRGLHQPVADGGDPFVSEMTKIFLRWALYNLAFAIFTLLTVEVSGANLGTFASLPMSWSINAVIVAAVALPLYTMNRPANVRERKENAFSQSGEA